MVEPDRREPSHPVAKAVFGPALLASVIGVLLAQDRALTHFEATKGAELVGQVQPLVSNPEASVTFHVGEKVVHISGGPPDSVSQALEVIAAPQSGLVYDGSGEQRRVVQAEKAINGGADPTATLASLKDDLDVTAERALNEGIDYTVVTVLGLVAAAVAAKKGKLLG